MLAEFTARQSSPATIAHAWLNSQRPCAVPVVDELHKIGKRKAEFLTRRGQFDRIAFDVGGGDGDFHGLAYAAHHSVREVKLPANNC